MYTDDVSEKTENVKPPPAPAPLSVTGKLSVVNELYSSIGSTAVAYTDDLEVIVVGQENGSVQLFEGGLLTDLLYDFEMVQEGEPCTDIKIRASAKTGFHKSILVTYLGGHIKLWDTKIGKCLFTMKEKRQIYGVNYHPRTSKFVTYGTDFKVYLYDEERRVTERILACSEIVGSKNGHTDSVCCAKFHPINPFEIVSSGLDGTIQYWDLRAPYAVRCITNVVHFGEALDVSHDGSSILVGVSNTRNGVIRIYDYSSGAKLKEYTLQNSHVYCCKYLTQVHVGVGGFLDNSFRIINIKTGQVLGTVSDLPGCVMSFTAKEKVLQQRTSTKELPRVLLGSAEKVLEVEAEQDAGDARVEEPPPAPKFFVG